jgi:hypothetical protein
MDNFKASIRMRQVRRRLQNTCQLGFVGCTILVLQQLWVDALSGITEWRDVPIEDEFSPTEENTSCS